MDNTLISAYSKDSAENASVLTRNDDRVNVDVEDDIDAEFWKDLLESLCPQKEFHFVPYHTNLKEDGSKVFMRGKAHVLRPNEEFNKWHIGCVDSDYDWLLSDYTEDGKVIKGNKYLLQTYAYSIENLMCLSSTLKDLCQDTTEETMEFDFADYMTRLSQTVYPLLIWSLYLCSQGKETFTPSAWRNVLVNTIRDAETSLALVAEKTKVIVETLGRDFSSEIEDKNKLETKLADEKSLTSNNAYLFVRGHELFDHLLNSVLGPIITILRQEHYKKLQATDLDSECRKSSLRAYQAKDGSIKHLLSHNYQYKGLTDLYDKIAHDVSLIWQGNSIYSDAK